MAASVELARQEWQEGSRRFSALHPDARLLAQASLLTEELRRRIGQTFTLAELALEYELVERWSRQVIEERAPFPGWSLNLALVEQAVFHAYSRGAIDYAP